MSSWHTLPRAAFDVETTGRDPRLARLVTASVVVVDGDGSIVAEHQWLADPGMEIPADVTQIHGISTAQAREFGIPAARVTAEVAEVLGALFAGGVPVIAFNACYDFTVLARESVRHGVAALGAKPVIDPYICNKEAHKFRRGRRTLGALCEEYGVSLKDAHTSAADAVATIRLAEALAIRFPQLQGDCHGLHERQIGWAAAQAADFQSYLRRTNPAASVEGTWPVLG
ncbi:3'-5' exonuclease [Paenarthrobacter sp. Z7-10]|uniref:3'-5' exonuclease n=1 Tax=Paenarthrobacter sp. Z7-10 TaxID=2787635 RepID=UPI0022A96E07|nr:3'-5' exonuclease [Paenarthrobacter sp. Z7-10]MCZ2403206.1 3'-5' exonuclease [Paenarthrobacter sp. Z7-10]